MTPHKLIYTQDELPQGSPEWLANRLGTLGGSEVACLMGASPWKTPEQLWEYKLGYAQDVFANTAAMDRGNRLEPIARDWYAKHYSHPVEPICLRHPQARFMWTSLDAISINRGKGDLIRIVEIKAPTTAANHRKHTEGGKVPDFRFPQIQHQLAVTASVFGYDSVSSCHYVSFWIDDKDPAAKPLPVVIRVRPEWDYISHLIEREAKFMDMVYRKIRPSSNDFPPIYRGEDGKLTAGVLALPKPTASSKPTEEVNKLPTGGILIYGDSADSYKRKPKAKLAAELAEAA